MLTSVRFKSWLECLNPCSLVEFQLYLYGKPKKKPATRKHGAELSTLNSEAKYSSETSVNLNQATRRRMQECSALHNHGCIIHTWLRISSMKLGCIFLRSPFLRLVLGPYIFLSPLFHPARGFSSHSFVFQFHNHHNTSQKPSRSHSTIIPVHNER